MRIILSIALICVGTGQAQSASSNPTAEPASREELTGDWGGARTELKNKGVDVEVKALQFVQGVASGGVDTGAVGTGIVQAGLKIDLEKLAGWKFWSVDAKTQTRYGGPMLPGTGSISPTNTAALIPGISGTVFAITSLNVTKLFPINLQKGDLIAVGGGRYNLFDLSEEHFFAGDGTEGFMNLTSLGPLTVLRQVPLITNMFTFAWVRGGKPFLSLAIMDPNDHSTNPGLKDLFADGVTFYPSLDLGAKYFGKTARHSFGASVTTKALTPFDAIRQVIIPGPPIRPIQPQRGSWSLIYTFRQYFVERGAEDGWGFFGQFGTAQRDTAPVTRFVNVGIGGNGLFERRKADNFGISYTYSDLSPVLKDNLDLLQFRRLLAEHQMEMFYNWHITPWLRLTGDLQIFRPTRPVAEVAIVPGGRLEVVF